MISKKLFLISVIFISIQTKEYPHNVTLKELFTDQDMALSIREQATLFELITTINNSSAYKQIEAAKTALTLLKPNLEQRRVLFESTKDESEQEFIGYKASILMAQMDHLETFIQETKQCLSLRKKATGFCKKYFKKLQKKNLATLS